MMMVHKEDMALVTSYPKERLEIFGRLILWFHYLQGVCVCVLMSISLLLSGVISHAHLLLLVLAVVAQVCGCRYLYTGFCACALGQSQWYHLADCLILVLLMLKSLTRSGSNSHLTLVWVADPSASLFVKVTSLFLPWSFPWQGPEPDLGKGKSQDIPLP